MNTIKQFSVGILMGLIGLLIVIGAGVLSNTDGQLSQQISLTAGGISHLTATQTVPIFTNTPEIATPITTQIGFPTVSAQFTIESPYPTLDFPPTEYPIYPVSTTSSTQYSTDIPKNPFFPSAVPKITNIACGAPYGWVDYYVVSGDTLYSLAILYRVSIDELQFANCLGTSSNIRVGSKLKVPNVSTSIPVVLPTLTPIIYPTDILLPSNTSTQSVLPTVTPGIPTWTPVPSSVTPFSGVG